MTTDSGPVRVEFLAAVGSTWTSFPHMLAACVLNVAAGDHSALPGVIVPDLVRIYEPSVTMTHLMLVNPFLWPDGDVSSIREPDYPVAWLMTVPVSDAELQFVRDNSAPELEAAQIDLFNLDRPSVV